MAAMTHCVTRWNVSSFSRKGVLAHARIPRKKVNREDTYDEGVIERHLRRRVRAAGGQCKKAKTGETGWPDRMCLWPTALTDFIETKRPKGGRFEPLQLKTHADLRKLGYRVFVINTKKQGDAYVHATQALIFRRKAQGQLKDDPELVETFSEPAAMGDAAPSDYKGAKR